jgi:hypothetical protein
MRRMGKLGNTGSSLVFVLGAMLMLMAVSLSVLVAASVSAAAARRQMIHSQLMLLDASVHRNLQHALTQNPTDATSLSSQLAFAIFQSNELPDGTGTAFADLDSATAGQFTIGIPGLTFADGTTFTSGAAGSPLRVEIFFREQNTTYTAARDYVPAIPEEVIEDADGNEIGRTPGRDEELRKAATGSISAQILVRVTLTQEGETMTSTAAYRYTRATLTDDFDNSLINKEASTIAENDIIWQFATYGEWELEKYEKIDT